VLKTAGKQGPIKKRITVTSNDPSKKDLVLELEGEITVDVIVEPRDISFKQVSKGQTDTREVSIKTAEPGSIKIDGVKIEGAQFELKQVSGDLATESKWSVKFLGAQELGPTRTSLIVSYTASGPQTLTVPVRATVVGDLMYQRTVRFVKSQTGEIAPRTIQFKSRTGKPLKISKIEDPDGLLKYEITKAQSDGPEIVLTVPDPSKELDARTPHVLKVHTGSIDEPVAEITYTFGVAREPGKKGFPLNMKKHVDIPNAPQ
jgi:hypothetical protein